MHTPIQMIHLINNNKEQTVPSKCCFIRFSSVLVIVNKITSNRILAYAVTLVHPVLDAPRREALLCTGSLYGSMLALSPSVKLNVASQTHQHGCTLLVSFQPQKLITENREKLENNQNGSW